MAWQSTTCIRKNGAGKHAFFSKKRVFRNFGPLVGAEDIEFFGKKVQNFFSPYHNATFGCYYLSKLQF